MRVQILLRILNRLNKEITQRKLLQRNETGSPEVQLEIFRDQISDPKCLIIFSLTG